MKQGMRAMDLQVHSADTVINLSDSTVPREECRDSEPAGMQSRGLLGMYLRALAYVVALVPVVLFLTPLTPSPNAVTYATLSSPSGTTDECGCRYELLRGGHEPFRWTLTNGTAMRHGQEHRVFEMQAPFCEMRRFEEEETERSEAVECLRGRHIVMIGDSLMRYQYLSLARWVDTGAWSGTEPWIEVEVDFGSWEAYYKETNDFFNGHELCDCYRDNNDMPGTVENRYFYHPELDIRLTYLNVFHHSWKLKGHNLTWLEGYRQSGRDAQVMRNTNATGCEPGHCGAIDHPYHWQGSPLEALEEYVIPILQPTDLVLNAGHWYRLQELDMTRLMALGLQAVDSKGREKAGHAYYRTTTTHFSNDPKDERAAAADVETGGWRVIEDGRYTHLLPEMSREEALIRASDGDTTGFYSPFFWDPVHFSPQVNAGFNQVLLNMMCPSQRPCTRVQPQWEKEIVSEPDDQEGAEAEVKEASNALDQQLPTKRVRVPEDYWTAATSVLIPWREELYRQSGIIQLNEGVIA